MPNLAIVFFLLDNPGAAGMESAGPSLIGILAQHGLPGVIIALLVLWVYMKDKELKAERDARIADAKTFTDLALKLQENAISSVNKLTDVFDEVKRMRRRRDREQGE